MLGRAYRNLGHNSVSGHFVTGNQNLVSQTHVYTELAVKMSAEGEIGDRSTRRGHLTAERA